MDKQISTAFLLTPEEDTILRVEAAKIGLSKTKMAQQVIKDWIAKLEDSTTIRQRITNISARIAEKSPNGKESLFDSLDKIISKSCDYIEIQVKLGDGDLLRSTETNRLDILKNNTLNSLTENIELINHFCETEALAPLTKLNAEEFACEIVKEYFETRTR